MNAAKIKFIVDESVDFSVVEFLRRKGFDVISIAEDYPSLKDINILNAAFKENRILVANDKDFGFLIFKLKIKSRGFILFRLHDQSSKAKIKTLDLAINNYSSKLFGNFVVVSERKVRIKKLPAIPT